MFDILSKNKYLKMFIQNRYPANVFEKDSPDTGENYLHKDLKFIQDHTLFAGI